MKKVLYTSTVIMLLVTAGSALPAENLWLGLRAGPSIPRLSGGNNEVSRGFSTILAPNFGVVAEYFLREHFSLQSELNYSGQGGERVGVQPITIEGEGLPPLQPGQYLYADFRNKSILNYLELPVMAKYHKRASDRWRYFIQGGPYIGYLLNATERTRGTSLIYVDRRRTPLTIGGQPLPPVSFNADTNVRSDLNRMNWGITAGMGAAYLLGNRNTIFLDVRGEYGLRNVQRNTAVNGNNNTGAAVFSVGYLFNPGR